MKGASSQSVRIGCLAAYAAATLIVLTLWIGAAVWGFFSRDAEYGPVDGLAQGFFATIVLSPAILAIALLAGVIIGVRHRRRRTRFN